MIEEAYTKCRHPEDCESVRMPDSLHFLEYAEIRVQKQSPPDHNFNCLLRPISSYSNVIVRGTSYRRFLRSVAMVSDISLSLLRHVPGEAFLLLAGNVFTGECMEQQRKKILVVEDDAIIATSESMILSGGGFDVISALNGEKAVDLVRSGREQIDLILMDVDLGKGMDGTQAAGEILKDHDIPVVFISSHTEKEIVEKTAKITSYGYVVKETGDAVMLASVRMAFMLYEANRALREKEAALRENEERFRLVALNSPDHIFHQDADLRYTWVANPASPLAIAVREGKTDRDFFGEEEAARIAAIKRRVIEEGVSARTEAYLIDADGSKRLFEGFYEPRRDAAGRIVGLTGYARDISERRKMEEMLARSERQHRVLVEGMNESLMQVDNDDVILFVNDQFCALTGYAREELLGRRGFDILFDARDAGRMEENNRRRLQGISDAYEIRLKKKSGHRIWVQISGSPVDDARGNVVGSIGVITDITERKHAEEALRRSEEKFRGIFENAPLGIFQSTFEGRLLSVNATALKMFGYSAEDRAIMGAMNVAKDLFVDPARRESFLRAAKESETFVTDEVEYRRKNGTEFRAILSMRSVRDAEGKPLMLEGFVEDITERLRLESVMRENEEHLREIADNMMDMVVRVDVGGVFRYVSPSHERVLGFRPAELLGTWAPALMHPDDRDEVVSSLRSIFRAGTGSLRFRARHKSGEYRWLESTGRSVANESGVFVGAVIGSRDITDRQKAEERLVESLKEKEILVKEVLHRVKNNLNLVASLLRLQSGYVVSPEDADLFREARDRITALARIHENLYRSRNLARVDFRSYVSDIVRNLAEAYRNERIRTRLEVAATEVGVDRAIPLGLIVNELVTNCMKYAFPDDRVGEIVVSYAGGEGTGEQLSVRDNGVGIPPALEVGSPQTFGLSLVNLLAEQINGKLEVKSGDGTEFILRFPG